VSQNSSNEKSTKNEQAQSSDMLIRILTVAELLIGENGDKQAIHSANERAQLTVARTSPQKTRRPSRDV
jgi:hypothetical protein